MIIARELRLRLPMAPCTLPVTCDLRPDSGLKQRIEFSSTTGTRLSFEHSQSATVSFRYNRMLVNGPARVLVFASEAQPQLNVEHLGIATRGPIAYTFFPCTFKIPENLPNVPCPSLSAPGVAPLDSGRANFLTDLSKSHRVNFLQLFLHSTPMSSEQAVSLQHSITHPQYG